MLKVISFAWKGSFKFPRRTNLVVALREMWVRWKTWKPLNSYLKEQFILICAPDTPCLFDGKVVFFSHYLRTKIMSFWATYIKVKGCKDVAKFFEKMRPNMLKYENNNLLKFEFCFAAAWSVSSTLKRSEDMMRWGIGVFQCF